jgi:hypothetical protein
LTILLACIVDSLGGNPILIISSRVIIYPPLY